MSEDSKTYVFKLQADICRTLADPTRLMLLHQLSEGEESVGQLVSNLGLPQANVSRHLAILREREIVSTRREGTTIYYSLSSPKIAEACNMVREVLESQLVRQQNMIGSLGSLKTKTGGSKEKKPL